MMVGFFKKSCVADLSSVYVNSIYNSPDDATSLGVIIATALFAVQIYCDFSGYTDIAIGCSRIMGIRLMQNFDHPYYATTVKKFWSRWHISLSSWFKDYLYIPLGGSRCSRPRYFLNVMIVFLVSGLWHGANWTFVIWGALHGIYQILGTITLPSRNKLLERLKISPTSAPVLWFRRLMTFVLVGFAWIFFRANTVSDAFSLIDTLFVSGWSASISDTLTTMGLDITAILMTVLSILSLIILDRLLTYRDNNDSSAVLTKNGAFIYLIWIIMFAWGLLLSKDMVSTFIYFQF
jgi:D-alanyl-lipoteichoic acid acyltransferase DltB (MBOAT superfamily)